MKADGESARKGWRTLIVLAALAAPLFAVLWLGITLTSSVDTLPIAVVKIVFTIAAVVTALLGIRWATASGIALLIEALLVVAWMLLKVEQYTPYGALRTALLLTTPLAASGLMFVLADGMRAGTWPPQRFRRRRAD
jgi:O-antigen/teichoic acid export membrane protein